MQLKLDTNKTYAIALEGGGARGSYQIGAWRALNEAGIKYNAVSGSSVGALNGAMMAMGSLDKAEEIWKNMRFSQVMDVDDNMLSRIFERKLSLNEMKAVVKQTFNIIRDGGIDVQPLRRLLRQEIDENAIKSSAVDLFLVTYSLTDRKELDISAKDLGKNELYDMLLASAYLPVFKNEKLGGKRYTDGGLQDVFPLNSLITRGYTDIIAIRIFGVGFEKRVTVPENVNITTIAPEKHLGSILNFSSEQCQNNIKLGYFDAKRVLYGLEGYNYYLERTWSEKNAYRLLCDLRPPKASLRRFNEEILPETALSVSAVGDYYDVLIRLIENAAKFYRIGEFEIMTDEELFSRVCIAAKNESKENLPEAVKFIADK